MPNPKLVRDLFAVVARRYDLMNHVLSCFIDRSWRRRVVAVSGVSETSRVLDICAGTGDIMVEFAKKTRPRALAGIDFSLEMLEIAQRKLTRAGKTNGAILVGGDALRLPFRDGGFDIVTMGFGLRNLSDYRAGIAEAARMLAPKGRLMILEFAPPKRGLFLVLYRIYLRVMIPVIGGLLTGRWTAYRYLSDTIAGFLRPSEVSAIFGDCGLVNVRAIPLTFGIAYIYYGERKG
jgi:demethylmenaquinone methyltransferase / 2-methoxy-6-polyprenyl-1,4-benzoquinol methylase